MRRSAISRFLRVLLWIAGGLTSLILVVYLVIQIILSPSVSSRLIDRYAPQYVDGKLGMSGVSVSVFRHFPRITADIDSLVLTYPAERFDSLSTLGAKGLLVRAGCYRPAPGDDSTTVRMDTLASFHKFSASVNPFPLLRGVLRLNDVRLEHPRAYIHRYNDGSSNLDILKFTMGDGVEQQPVVDTTSSVEGSSSMPRIEIKKIHLGSKPLIVYTDQADTLMALVTLKEFAFNGRLSTASLQRSSFKTDLDSMWVTGRMGADTLIFGLDHLGARCRRGTADVDAQARVYAATRNFGRITIPIGLEGQLGIRTTRDDNIGLYLAGVDLDVASLCLQADMDVVLADKINLEGSVIVPGVPVQDVIDDFGVHIMPQLADLRTDAKVDARFNVNGWYDSSTGELPQFDANLSVPRSDIHYAGYTIVPSVELKLTAAAAQSSRVDCHVEECCIQAPGLDLDVTGSVNDVLGTDPAIGMDASLTLALDTLGRYLEENFDISASGRLTASAKGKFSLSQLSMYNFSNADVTAKADASRLMLASLDDSLYVYVDSLQLRTGLMDDRFSKKKVKDGKKRLAAMVKIDTVKLDYKDAAHISGSNLSMLMQGATSAVTLNDTLKYNPVFARLSLGAITLEGADSLRLSLRESVSRLGIHPSSRNDRVPVININSTNKRIRAAKGPHRVMLSALDFDAKAQLKKPGNKRRVSTFMDSLSRLHPELSRDSLIAYMRANARNKKLPDWMSDEDLRKSDIKLDFGESFRNYYNKWDFSGNLSLASARVATPAFPLRTRITGFHGSFDNDKVSLDTLCVVSGASNFSASGNVSNLKRSFARRGIIKLDLGLNTDSLAISELLNAYALGQANMQSDLSHLSDASDEAVEHMVEKLQKDVDADTTASELIVIPANVNARIRLRGRGVSYSSLRMNHVSADLTMRERCLLLSDVNALTSAGNFYADAFYSTKTRKNLTAGFDVTFKDISAGQVIELMPQLDTLMPLIKSFDGMLNCNLAATAQLDTCMNLVMPSVNGVMRITGSDLHFNDNKEITKIARMLWVKNPTRATIDTMTVEAIVKDNTVEIFPFVMRLGKWAVAMAGVQNLDESFQYHVSVARSPFGLKLGANIYGPDFDHMKFKLGRAKYRNLDLPSFSTLIDTTRINLRGAIENIFEQGVERALRENMESQNRIQRARESRNYNHSVALDSLESVTAADRLIMNSVSLDSLDNEGAQQQQEDEGAETAGDVAVLHENCNPSAQLYASRESFALPPRRFAYDVASLVDEG